VIVKRILEGLRPGNLAVLDDHPGYWQTGQVFPATFAAFPDFRMTVERQIAEGDIVATFAICRGTHLGTYQGIPPTGKRSASRA
jgi:predicted ester cyclase